MTSGNFHDKSFQPKCLVLDLEVGKANGKIHQIGATRPDTGAQMHWRGRQLIEGLKQLETLSQGASFVLGHNIINFDLPQLAAHQPDLCLLQLPAVDTLWLNPLAFPRNPYHKLVKHYQDGQLVVSHRNDALKDAQLALALFRDQHAAFKAQTEAMPELTAAWHWLTTQTDQVSGTNRFFNTIRNATRPSRTQALAAIRTRLSGQVCLPQAETLLSHAETQGWSLAYALAWLSVAGGNSVMPPWVRHQFPEAAQLISQLRDTSCGQPDCPWCQEHHNARQALRHWFNFGEFRPEPQDPLSKTPLQQVIVEQAMARQHLLGILPTGTGKSICYQIPALSRFAKTGALTVVISPLVALMADQVAGLQAKGIYTSAAINGMLTPPERADVLDRIRLGDIGILVISPEQLRNKTLRKTLAQREIGAWVLDEAHCLSKWGHDFRPDYRYVGRFIKEKSGNGLIPAVLCLTATAKPDVVTDIAQYFHSKVGIELQVLDGGAKRENLDFLVARTTEAHKFGDIWQHLQHELPEYVPGGAIVYCATRKQTEDVAAFLRDKGIKAEHFHSQLKPETKKSVQSRFINGEIRVIAATNAFGMGIDKPDVRLVIHADIPGSLENYLQEAGRAGRDRQAALCILLFTDEDVERQFGMSARSRLSQKEIKTILKSLRQLLSKKQRHDKTDNEVIATSGEILEEDEEEGFHRDSASDDTRVRTAISWLEEAQLLSREENQVQIFPASLRIGSSDEAKANLEKTHLPVDYKKQLLTIIDTLLNADADEGISTDELTTCTGLKGRELRKAFADLESLGIASNDTALTAYVHHGVPRASQLRLEQAVQLEKALIAEMRAAAPDMAKGDTWPLHLRIACQHIRDAGHPEALPQTLYYLLKGLAGDGRNEDGGNGSIGLKRHDGETVSITLQREWSALDATAQRRQQAAQCLLAHLIGQLPSSARGTDLLAESTLGKLAAAISNDIELSNLNKDPQALVDRALLWLHELDIIRLNKGLAVFHPAMTIRLDGNWKKQFNQSDYQDLRNHYDEQVTQIHVMAEYVQVGLSQMADALRLALDYFALPKSDFLKRWLPGREKELSRQTTPESWRTIVEDLGNKSQKDIVADSRESTNLLILAGPGSGKTRVLVHRIAFLVRCQRENPRSILALAYNRHAAVQIRQRLQQLIGDDARHVLVATLHGLAMRLLGASLEDKSSATEDTFRQMIQDATRLLKGEIPGTDEVRDEAESDQLRSRLLGGFRWLLVDEYQDINPDQYDLISALAGRGRDEDERINLLAVGDDDQNIYAFNGASTDFIRRFEADYQAKPAYLLENYRSTGHIITAANQLIAPLPDRLKARHPIAINQGRKADPPGGPWAKLDPVSQGRVQILPVEGDTYSQALAVMTELQRLAQLDPHWQWSRCAVIAREWRWLEALRSHCRHLAIPCHWGQDDSLPYWRLRDFWRLRQWLQQCQNITLTLDELRNWSAQQPPSATLDLLNRALDEFGDEVGAGEFMSEDFKYWLAEWRQEAQRSPVGLSLLSAHKAKGLEFDHVVVMDGHWLPKKGEEPSAIARLYYVAMTRAKKTLTLVRLNKEAHPLLDGLQQRLEGASSLLCRQRVLLPPAGAHLQQQVQWPGLESLYLSFAGNKSPQDDIHQRIGQLKAGDPLQLVKKDERWQLCNDQGQVVGQMSGKFQHPANMMCLEARVRHILVWDKSSTDPKYQQPQCEAWELVVPEFIFAPGPQP